MTFKDYFIDVHNHSAKQAEIMEKLLDVLPAGFVSSVSMLFQRDKDKWYVQITFKRDVLVSLIRSLIRTAFGTFEASYVSSDLKTRFFSFYIQNDE